VSYVGGLFYEQRMVIVYLLDIPAWAKRQQLWRTLTTGLDYLQWRTLFVLVKHALQPKVQIKSAWGQSPIQQCQFSHSPAGQWI